MSDTAINFEDLISHDILLRYYYCICCLEHNGPFIRIAKCVHSEFLKTFPMPDFSPPIPKVICLKCHSTLKKINNFQKQVQESYGILFKKAHLQNKINTKSNLTISKVEHLFISENECTIDNVHIKIVPQTNEPNMAFKNTKNIETALNIINTNANSLQSLVSNNLKSLSDTLLVVANEHLNLEPTRNTVLPASSIAKFPSEKYIIAHSSKRKVLSNEIKDIVLGKRKNLNTTANIDDKTNSLNIKPDLVTDEELLKMEEELITEDLNINEDEITNNEYEIKPFENKDEAYTDVKINSVDVNTENKHNEGIISNNTTKTSIKINNEEVTTDIDLLNSEIVLPMDVKKESEEEVVIDLVYGTNVLPKDLKMEPDDSETDGGRSLKQNETRNDFTMDVSTSITSQTLNHKELQVERDNKLKSKDFLKWQHRCDSCIIGFKFKENLDDHNKRKHEMREGHVSCQICRQAVDVDNIDDHTSKHYNRVIAIPKNRNQYKRKIGAQPRIPISENNLRIAVKEVLDGKSIRGTSKLYNISVMTLKRYVRKKQAALQDNIKQDIKYGPDYRNAQIFTSLEEEELKSYLETASKLNHGLSPYNIRQLSYQYLCDNGKNIPLKWRDKEIASHYWYYGFMNRNKSLSVSRVTAFNKNTVLQFFGNLNSTMLKFQFRANQIWNIDETDLTTVHKPRKNASGLKQMSKSGEKLDFVTVCGAINAVGNHLPPFMIFPRENFESKMTENGPTGIEGLAHPSGYMTGPNFLEFLKFFVKHVKCNKENQCLMVLDNHESHITINSIDFAEENGIHLFTIPTHISQKVLPLDRLFRILKTYYNSACDDWITSHPEHTMTIYDIAGLLAKAYPKAMTPKNIEKCFEITGIYPLNSELSTDEEFLSSD